MKSPRATQSGVTVFEVAICIVAAALIWSAMVGGQAALDRAMARTLVAEMQSVQQMLLAYQDRYDALPGDDSMAASRFPGATSASSAGAGDGAIGGGDWAGEASASVSAADESSLFWQHVRMAGLARGDPARFEARNSVRGLLGISSSNAAMPTKPAGARKGFHVCSGHVEGYIARRMDADIDDGDATTGKLWASEESDGVEVLEAQAASPYDDSKSYTVCMLF